MAREKVSYIRLQRAGDSEKRGIAIWGREDVRGMEPSTLHRGVKVEKKKRGPRGNLQKRGKVPSRNSEKKTIQPRRPALE